MLTLPERVCGEEGDVEGLLLWVVLQGHQDSIAEPHVGQQLQSHQPVTGRAVVGIEHLARVEELPREHRIRPQPSSQEAQQAGAGVLLPGLRTELRLHHPPSLTSTLHK